MRSLLPTLLNLAGLATAANLTVSITPTQQLSNPSTLPPSTHAILLGPPGIRYSAPIRRDNTFHFTDLPDASYLLTLHTLDFFFPPLRVDVAQTIGEAGAGEELRTQTIEAWQTFRGNEWSNKGPSYGSSGNGALTIQVRANGVKEYYQERGGFSLVSFLKSPMILMGLAMAALVFGMPYLMDNMDPEMKAEFEEMQKKGPIAGGSSAANSLQNFDLAGWMAGSPAESGSAKKK